MVPPHPLRRLALTAGIGIGLATGTVACADGTNQLATETTASVDSSGSTTGSAPTSTSSPTSRSTSSPTSRSTASSTSRSTASSTSGPGGAETTSATPSTAEPPATATEAIDYRVEVVTTHPHDPTAFTQGLEVVGDLLLESTGLRGESTIRLVEPTTGEVLRSRPLDPDLFGEGATVVGDEIWQLTWTSGRLLVHGLDDLELRGQRTYGGEGWGLCAGPEHLIMSNGSSQLTIRDRTTFEIIDAVEVTDDDGPVARLNELECVGELVWANVYQTTRMVAIDPTDGRVVGSADLADLVPPGFEGDGNNVANGIASDPATGRFWLTGKRWPVLYEVELIPEP